MVFKLSRYGTKSRTNLPPSRYIKASQACQLIKDHESIVELLEQLGESFIIVGIIKDSDDVHDLHVSECNDSTRMRKAVGYYDSIYNKKL